MSCDPVPSVGPLCWQRQSCLVPRPCWGTAPGPRGLWRKQRWGLASNAEMRATFPSWNTLQKWKLCSKFSVLYLNSAPVWLPKWSPKNHFTFPYSSLTRAWTILIWPLFFLWKAHHSHLALRKTRQQFTTLIGAIFKQWNHHQNCGKCGTKWREKQLFTVWEETRR